MVASLETPTPWIFLGPHLQACDQGYQPRLQGEQQGKSFDVVFVSSDKDEGSFREYFGTMPWHALPFARRDLQMTLGQRFGVRGIPAVKVFSKTR